MAWDPDSAVAPPPQPGVNGIRYSAKTGYVYYTSTAQKVFMRVRVDKASLDPAGDPELLAGIDNCDDFCIDENAGFAYVSRHRANTLDRVPLQPQHGSEVRHIVDDPSDKIMVGPTSAALAARSWRFWSGLLPAHRWRQDRVAVARRHHTQARAAARRTPLSPEGVNQLQARRTLSGSGD